MKNGLLPILSFNKFLFYLFAITLNAGCITAPTSDRLAVEKSNGQLVVLHDQKSSCGNDDNPFGSAILFDEFVEVFDSDIKMLSKEDQVRFLWAAMWHLDFDGHSMMQFQSIVAKNCGAEFVEKLEGYVKKETELQRNKTRLHLSEKVLFGIKQIMDRGDE